VIADGVIRTIIARLFRHPHRRVGMADGPHRMSGPETILTDAGDFPDLRPDRSVVAKAQPIVMIDASLNRSGEICRPALSVRCESA
jgi:hypothetical protein